MTMIKRGRMLRVSYRILQGADIKIKLQGADIKIKLQGADIKIKLQGADIKIKLQGADIKIKLQGADIKIKLQGADRICFSLLLCTPMMQFLAGIANKVIYNVGAQRSRQFVFEWEK